VFIRIPSRLDVALPHRALDCTERAPLHGSGVPLHSRCEEKTPVGVIWSVTYLSKSRVSHFFHHRERVAVGPLTRQFRDAIGKKCREAESLPSPGACLNFNDTNYFDAAWSGGLAELSSFPYYNLAFRGVSSPASPSIKCIVKRHDYKNPWHARTRDVSDSKDGLPPTRSGLDEVSPPRR